MSKIGIRTKYLFSVVGFN